MILSRWLLRSRRRNISEVVYKIKTCIFGKSYRLWDNVEECGRARQALDNYIIRRMRFACWITKATHTRMNTHTHTHTHTHIQTHAHTEYVVRVSFSTTVVMRTNLNVALYVPCLSCWETVFCYWWYWKNLSVDYTLGWGGNKNTVKKCQSYIYQFHSKDMCWRKPWTAPAGLRGIGPRGAVNDWPFLLNRESFRLSLPLMEPERTWHVHRNLLLLVRNLRRFLRLLPDAPVL